jgi:hypothetical protein
MSKTITISAKCSDMFSASLQNDGETVKRTEGDILDGFAIGGGDYVTFTLDIATGKIVGFDPEEANRAFDKLVNPTEDEEDIDW